MPTCVAPAGTGRAVSSSTPQSPQLRREEDPSASRSTGSAALTFLQPLMSAAASVVGAEKSSGTLSLSSERPCETTHTESHIR